MKAFRQPVKKSLSYMLNHHVFIILSPYSPITSLRQASPVEDAWFVAYLNLVTLFVSSDGGQFSKIDLWGSLVSKRAVKLGEESFRTVMETGLKGYLSASIWTLPGAARAK
jgi:hypothetical protein